MTDHRVQVAEALAAVAIRSRLRFAWLGRLSPAVPRDVAPALNPADARRILVRRLRARLYESFYCRGGVVAAPPQTAGPGRIADPALAESYARANTSRRSWQSGWRLQGADGDALIAARHGLSVRIGPSEYRPHPGGRCDAHDVDLAFPSHLARFSPGYHTVLGEEDLGARGTELIVRLYFNVGAELAADLLHLVTATLNGARVPFRFKVADHPDGFARCDAAVLYLRATDEGRRRGVVRALVRGAADGLERPTPVFTRQVAPGVGLAEEPAHAKESFGMRRCRLLAEAVVDAHERGIHDPAGRMRSVEHRFARAGISLDTPHLEAGSADCYGSLCPEGMDGR